MAKSTTKTAKTTLPPVTAGTSKSTKPAQDTALFTRLAKSRGRFFGLYLKSGEKINAQYRSQTSRSLMVFDRNNARNRRLDKTKVVGASI